MIFSQPPSRRIVLPKRYDGVNAQYVVIPPNASQELTAQTALVGCIIRGGGPVSSPILFTHSDSAAANGIIFRISYSINASSFRLQCDSTGTSGAPLRQSGGGTPSLLDNTYYDLAFSWTGSLTATTIRLYFAALGQALAEVSGYGTTTNGTTAIKGPAGQRIILGNRGDLIRPFQGDIFYWARWNRVLDLAELELAKKYGPPSVPSGLTMFWVNGADHSPYALKASAWASIPDGSPSLYVPTVRESARLYSFPAAAPAGGGFFARYYYDMAA